MGNRNSFSRKTVKYFSSLYGVLFWRVICRNFFEDDDGTAVTINRERSRLEHYVSPQLEMLELDDIACDLKYPARSSNMTRDLYAIILQTLQQLQESIHREIHPTSHVLTRVIENAAKRVRF